MDDIGENTAKTVLQPRRPGESIKVAETVLKRRDRNLKANAERKAQILQQRQSQKNYRKGKLNIVRAETFVKQARLRQADEKRIRHMKKKYPKGPKPVRQCKVLAVVRNNRSGGTKRTRTMLKELSLTQPNSLLFMQNTPENAAKLMTCKPFCYWGRLKFKTLLNIVHKKALFQNPDGGDKVLLSDNTLIEKHLGQFNCLCTEDLAHVLHNDGENFKEVTSCLSPVPLGDLKKSGGLVQQRKWTTGNLQDAMDDKICRLIGD